MIITAMKRIRSRPGLRGKPPSESTMNTTETAVAEKSESFSSLKSQASGVGRKTRVCFAMDYQEAPHEVYPADPTPLSEDEMEQAFYSSSDLHRFDKDRALTVLTYETRNANSPPWDDNLYSLRGLEEYVSLNTTNMSSGAVNAASNAATAALSSSPLRHMKSMLPSPWPVDEGHTGSSRRHHRQALIHAVLAEQARLQHATGRAEVATAAASLGTNAVDLTAELLRGVSCAHSKGDKQRALQLGQKDEKEVKGGCNSGRRRYLAMVKGKINDWANTSNRSVGSTNTASESR